LLRQPQYGHLAVIHLPSRRAASDWLASLMVG
jgi:hypothetical protein